MVVDDIEHHREAGAVRRIHQPLETFRATIARLHSVQRNSVVPPVALARKRRHRHNLNRSHAKRMQVIELLDHTIESSFRRERPNVQFVNDVLVK